MVNIAEILKNAPKGLKLYSIIHGEVEFDSACNPAEYPIGIRYGDEYDVEYFDEYGKYFNQYGEPILFPSKDHQTWDNWQEVLIPKCVGSVIVTSDCIYEWLVTKDGMFAMNMDIDDIYLHPFNEMFYDTLRFATPKETEAFFERLDKLGYRFENGEVVKKEEKKWSILDAKDGDFVYDNKCDKVFIFKKIGFGNSVERHAAIDFMGNWSTEIERPNTNYSFLESNDLYGRYRLATEKEISFFLEKLNDGGYHWNPLSKHLLKRNAVIEKKFAINDFKPFDKVLVRDCSEQYWNINLFSHYDETSDYPYRCLTCDFIQCIPYNEETSHLLDTTEEYNGKYKTWED